MIYIRQQLSKTVGKIISFPKSKRQRALIWAFLLLLIISVTSATLFTFRRASAPNHKTTNRTSVAPNTQTDSNRSEQSTHVIRFAAMGDMLPHDTVVQQAKHSDAYDFSGYFKDIKQLYSDADAVFCNIETLAAGGSLPVSGYPSFNAPTEFIRDLSSAAGCNVINLANNHIGDKNQAAIDATISNWESYKPLAIAGANRSEIEQRTVRYFEKNDIKVAFLAFADYSNNKSVTSYGLNTYHNEQLVTDLMREAVDNSDAVVISMHWGTENKITLDADQEKAAQLLAGLGADVIIGTGPHVLQKATYLIGGDDHKTLVWYSLGNMLSSQLKINELTGGVAGFSLIKNVDGKVAIENPTFKSTFMSYDWPEADKTAGNLLARNNLQLRPLEKASDQLANMFGATLNERIKFVQDTLTADAGVVINPKL